MEGLVHEESGSEDPIEDVEELDDEDDGEEMSPEEIGEPQFISARTYQRQRQRAGWQSKPDVLGYLNQFRDLDDQDRARLCRSVATYLQNQINTRNGLYRRRSVGFRKDKEEEDLTRSKAERAGKKLKRTKSVRDLTAEFASAPE